MLKLYKEDGSEVPYAERLFAKFDDAIKSLRCASYSIDAALGQAANNTMKEVVWALSYNIIENIAGIGGIVFTLRLGGFEYTTGGDLSFSVMETEFGNWEVRIFPPKGFWREGSELKKACEVEGFHICTG